MRVLGWVMAFQLAACAAPQVNAPPAFEGLRPSGSPIATNIEDCARLSGSERGVLVGVAAAGLLAVLGGLTTVGRADVAPEATVGMVSGGALLSTTSILGGWAFDRANCPER
ncbi:MAG: hypothetical protein IPG45_24070 [Deltaproteobacteria bacterium]|jgi:hypothetical protein|nr:hypothetical protein [Deltaproteobacteria bacterium]